MFEYNESLEVLKEIRDYLESINDKLEDIKDECTEIKSNISKFTSHGIYGFEDIYDKLSSIETSIDCI